MSALTFRALRRLADGRFHSGVDVARALGRSRATLSEALKRAPDLGVELFRVRGKGYRLAEPIEFLDPPRVAAAMGAAAARVRLELADEVDSTSTRLMARAAAGEPSGACLAAEWQSAGRGRRGHSWVASLGGGLTFSLLWRFERGAGHLAGLSLAASVAVARALAAAGVAHVRVKWPNDVVLDLRKLAGILVETSGEMQGPSVAVVGVGVNYRLGEAALGRIDRPACDVAGALPVPPARSDLLGRILAELVGVLDAFEREGFASVRDEWRALHAYHGRAVRVVPAGGAPYEAEVRDVAEDGTLVVSVEGRTERLAAAEISLR